MGETLGNYEEATAEIVDSTPNLEGEMAREIENEIKKVNEETADIAEDQLDNMTQNQLKDFLIARYFKDHSKEDLKYSNIKKSENFLRFSMKAALKFLVDGKEDKTKYNETTGLKVGENDGNGLTAEEILKKHGGIDLDEDSVLIKILQDKVHAKVDGKPGAQTIAKVIGALGGDLSEIYQQVNDLYPNNKNLSMENIQTKELFGTSYNIDTGRFTLANDGEAYTLIDNLHSDKTYKIVKEGDNIVVKKGDEPTDEITVDVESKWIRAKNTAPGDQQEVTPHLSENDIEIDGNVVLGGKGKNVTIDDINVVKYGNEKSKNSTLFVYDSNGKLVDANQVWVKYMLDQDILSRGSGTLKVSSNDAYNRAFGGKFSYDNGNINYHNESQDDLSLTKDADGYTIGYKGMATNGEYEKLPFKIKNEYQALRTAKFILYIVNRCHASETGADKGNPEYYKCEDNDSPFFVTDKGLYWSDNGGSTDTDIMSINNMQNMASEFSDRKNRINLAKFLSRTTYHHGDDEGRYQTNSQADTYYSYL